MGRGPHKKSSGASSSAKSTKSSTGTLVIGSVLVAILYLWLDPFASAYVDHQAIRYLEYIASPLIKAHPMVFRGTPDTKAYGTLNRKVTSTARLLTGDVLMRIPRASMIELESIAATPVGALLMEHNATIREALDAHGLQARMLVTAFYVMFLSVDRHDPHSKNELFWRLMPPPEVVYPPIMWTQEDLDCFKGPVQEEVAVVHQLIPTLEQAMTLLCHTVACDWSVTTDDVRWGIATYYALNVRQQLIAPALGLVRCSSSHPNVNLVGSRETNTLDIVVNRQVREGDELLLPVERDATYQIATSGSFDPNTAAVEIPIAYSLATKDAFLRKHCFDLYSSLVIKADGRPSTQLTRCVAAITATATQRASIGQYEHNPVWMEAIDRRIVALVSALNDTVAQLPAECPGTSHNIRDLQKRYARHMRQTIDHFFVMRRK